MKSLKNKNIFFIIIFLSVIFNFFNFYKIDYKYNKYSSLEVEHRIIKGEILKYWTSAKKSENYKIHVVDNYRNAYLYPKLLFVYSKILNFDFFDKNKNISLDTKFFIFCLQYIFYLLAVITFYKKFEKYFDKGHLNILLFILLLDPNINQHHYALFSESTFISLLILFLAFSNILIIKRTQNNPLLIFQIFLLGILLGLMFLTRSVSIYYIVVIFVFLIVIKNYSNIIFLSLGYSIVILFIGTNNLIVNEKFKIAPTQGGDAIYGYLAADVYAYENNLSIPEVRKLFFRDNVKNFLNINEEQLEDYRNNSKMVDIIKLNKYKSEESLKILTENPLTTIKILIFHYSKTLLIHPFWVNNFYQKNYIGRSDYKETNVNLSLQNKIRIIYSIIFYLLFLYGFYLSLKQFNWKINFLLFLSILYFYILPGFIGNPRYFLPSYTIMTIFVSLSIHYLFLKIKIPKNNFNKL
ncbi:hypothetical protein [Candidatus Pelagibacter sp. HIMB1782]|uniref:hypothetical protein n=1 Tax=Candidatus Pelagibacter sp. HIMB1782 TaxID=3413375 RepID=UPI003F82B57D